MVRSLCLLVPLWLSSCAQAPPPAKPHPPPRTTVVAAGDILLARAVGERMERTGDYSIPFATIAPTLSAADIALGNLEGPFCEKPPYTKEGMIFRVRPRGVESLVYAGFDVVNVANNHFGDGGNGCIEFSLTHLRGAMIAPVGSGLSFDEAHGGSVIVRNGVRFAFLGYSYAPRNDEPRAKNPVVAGRDPAQVRRDVAAARLRADVVFVSLHDGAEYTRNVARETQEFAHAAMDAGATAVFGHHPHVPQRIESYAGGWIFYSLGNFVFWQNDPAATRTALLARLTFSGAKLETVEALPVVIESPGVPRLANEKESAAILKAIGLTSSRVWPVN
ncbi:MAG: CapA family protein [Acidobacteria bacterium]|nr:CapA family protein [Acidobacteriota bacterium]MCL5287132.1 CapA family protein [Acidobacteriota bacterium]